MSKARLFLMSAFAVLAFGIGLALPMALNQLGTAHGDSCTLPSCSTTSVTSNPPPTSSPPPPPATAPTVRISRSPPRRRTRPARPVQPAPVTTLHARPQRRGVLLTWKLQSASLSDVLVRRSVAGNCPSTRSAGVAIGGRSVRTSQVDASARQRGRYCYAVLVVSGAGTVSTAATVDHVLVPDWTPPAPVTGLTARAVGRTVALHWIAPAGAPVRYVVRRTTGVACPAGPTDGILLGTPRTPSFTDTRVAAGTRYCYAVFPTDAAGNLQRKVIAAPIVQVPTPRTVAPAPAVSTAAASGGSRSNAGTLALAGLVAAAVLAAAIGGGRRLARPSDPVAGSGGSPVAARLGLDGADVRALVIPAVLVLITLVLVGVAVTQAV